MGHLCTFAAFHSWLFTPTSPTSKHAYPSMEQPSRDNSQTNLRKLTLTAPSLAFAAPLTFVRFKPTSSPTMPLTRATRPLVSPSLEQNQPAARYGRASPCQHPSDWQFRPVSPSLEIPELQLSPKGSPRSSPSLGLINPDALGVVAPEIPDARGEGTAGGARDGGEANARIGTTRDESARRGAGDGAGDGSDARGRGGDVAVYVARRFK